MPQVHLPTEPGYQESWPRNCLTPEQAGGGSTQMWLTCAQGRSQEPRVGDLDPGQHGLRSFLGLTHVFVTALWKACFPRGGAEIWKRVQGTSTESKCSKIAFKKNTKARGKKLLASKITGRCTSGPSHSVLVDNPVQTVAGDYPTVGMGRHQDVPTASEDCLVKDTCQLDQSRNWNFLEAGFECQVPLHKQMALLTTA